MPYIRAADKAGLHHILTEINHHEGGLTEGELNYLLTRCVQSYLNRKSVSYAAYNSAIGALECAKLELYRRKIALYENDKAAVNGDVY